MPGSSDVFVGSVVAYSNEVKTGLLGVSKKTLADCGAVSVEVVREMAEGALAVTGAQISIATSGIAGPGGGSEDKPVGTVCISVAVSSACGLTVCEAERHYFPGNRGRVIDASTTRGLIRGIKLLRRLDADV